MLIPIITSSKEPDSVPSYVLDRMIVCGEVHAFERSSGWVVIGRDPVRSTRSPYFGHERRRSVSFRAQSLAA